MLVPTGFSFARAKAKPVTVDLARPISDVPTNGAGYLFVTALYEGAPLMDEVVAYLAERDYVLLQTEPAYVHPRTGETMQVNGLFARNSA